MRSTCALYIDAGYLLAAAATRVTGTSLRSGIHVEYVKLISSLIDTAQELSGLPLLRVHWYDSARNGVPDARQERIGEIP
ncbi:NYN domain-containing protein, partial [Gordonia sp. HY442]|nr:NYN domain-containing protein [Gordonia zhenghanii]